MTHHKEDTDASSEAARIASARLIQRMWRGKNVNLAKDEYLNPESRWGDALNHAKLAVNRNAAIDGQNSPLKRWVRATYFVGQLKDKNKMLKEEGVEVDAEDKHLETQHWLELVDSKHRYGSNLKVRKRLIQRNILQSRILAQWYHRKWQEENTTDNFFKWLDHGGGKDLSLDECPRERLEKERILYLSAEQRLNYLVNISEGGKLLWAKNNLPVDTTPGHWKDTGDGQGIVPQGIPSRPASATTNNEPFIRATLNDSEDQDNAATHYAGRSTGEHGWSGYWRRHFTPRGIMERLLRKTVKRNTWIYVSDRNFNMLIGIKETGAFQHSSFISGGMVTSAGLISVKQGVIHTLSPLSGHYRTSIDHFHKFIDVLTERGVDMRKVRTSKAEAALWGIEHLTKIKKGWITPPSGKKTVKKAAHKANTFAKEIPEEASTWKREILTGRKSSQRQTDVVPENDGKATSTSGIEEKTTEKPLPSIAAAT